MKRKFLYLILTLLLIINSIAFVGCDIFNDDGNDGELPLIDNSVDLSEFVPTAEDDNFYIEGETYYTSKSVDLVTEINGNYTTSRPFTLDKDNENKRIYHNVYLYEEDFLQVIYYKRHGDLGQLYVIMSDTADQEYAEIEYGSQGSALQITVKKQGVYNVVLDVETFAIDLIKMGDIDTPVYETIKSCELNIHVSLDNYSYTPMTLDVTTNEYYIQKEIPLGASIGFYNTSHMGHYKMTVEPNIMDKLVYYDSLMPSQVYVHVGGIYKIYFNAKTYVLRLELQDCDTASYYCQVEWGKNNELTPASSATPYLFEYEFIAQGKINDPYVDIPSFYPKLGMAYKLAVIDVDGYVAYDEYITESGTYLLTINLKEFTLSIKRLSA